MTIRNLSRSFALGIAAVVLTAGIPAPTKAQQSIPAPVTLGNSDLGGVVTGARGPEAGVWVIAETADLPTQPMCDRTRAFDLGRHCYQWVEPAKYCVPHSRWKIQVRYTAICGLGFRINRAAVAIKRIVVPSIVKLGPLPVSVRLG
jgi:hypothetical protein